MTALDKIGDYLQPGRAWYTRDVKTITKITVHHTASKQVDDDGTALDHVYRSHIANGWPGSSYHFFIPKSGNIYQLNKFSWVTWHDTHNWDSIGVCLDGYFHAPENEKPTTEQLRSLKWLLDELCTNHPEFPASQGDVYGHRERSATACPGDTFFPMVKEYREKGGAVSWGLPEDTSTPCEKGLTLIREALDLDKDSPIETIVKSINGVKGDAVKVRSELATATGNLTTNEEIVSTLKGRVLSLETELKGANKQVVAKDKIIHGMTQAAIDQKNQHNDEIDKKIEEKRLLNQQLSLCQAELKKPDNTILLVWLKTKVIEPLRNWLSSRK